MLLLWTRCRDRTGAEPDSGLISRRAGRRRRRRRCRRRRRKGGKGERILGLNADDAGASASGTQTGHFRPLVGRRIVRFHRLQSKEM